MVTSCPICNATIHSVIYKEIPQYPSASIVKCETCGHRYTFLPNEIDSSALYSDEVYEVVENRATIFDSILNWEYNRVLKCIFRLIYSKGNLLDFGSGKGKFGWLAEKQGWTVKSIETSIERASYARKVYNLEVHTGFYEGGTLFNLSFNVITLFHVLEHLPQPEELLRKLTAGNLKENGLLLVEVPNLNSWQASIAGNKWMHLDVPRHLNHFTPSLLLKLMMRVGYTPVRIRYFSVHLGVLGMVDSLLKIFGYRKNIILQLKTKKSIGVILPVLLVLPFALVLEGIASLLGHGGIVRMYSVKTPKQ